MILHAVAIFDRASQSFDRPWFAPAIGQAIRAFSDAINDPQHPMHKHPDDYDLWHLGTFDDNAGTFTHHETGKKQIAIGKNLYIQPERE